MLIDLSYDWQLRVFPRSTLANRWATDAARSKLISRPSPPSARWSSSSTSCSTTKRSPTPRTTYSPTGRAWMHELYAAICRRRSVTMCLISLNATAIWCNLPTYVSELFKKIPASCCKVVMMMGKLRLVPECCICYRCALHYTHVKIKVTFQFRS